MNSKKTPVADTLLSDSKKKRIRKHIQSEELGDIINILDRVSTSHAGTAKTKDKRFVIHELVKHVHDNCQDIEKVFFGYGKYLCEIDSDNAKEVGVSIIWRGYRQNPGVTEKQLLRIADDKNWEVREYAGSAFASVLRENPKLQSKMIKWSGHRSENIRRAVVFSSLAYKERGDTSKAFEILSLLMSDSSNYVKKNLGPFILGSHFGNNFPDATFEFLLDHSKSIDLNVLWNVAMSFNNSFGNRYPKEALEILSLISQSNLPSVNRAIVSTLKHLNKRNENIVKAFCLAKGIVIK
ncbi:MAG: DNA alkylation repair protein [Ignavibacteria bacterium]|nr:DNA alkylation repair protein [Ignavibacteria bacterium]